MSPGAHRYLWSAWIVNSFHTLFDLASLKPSGRRVCVTDWKFIFKTLFFLIRTYALLILLYTCRATDDGETWHSIPDC